MKISCPNCERKWRKGAEIRMEVRAGYYAPDDGIDTENLIDSYKLCPYCFLGGDFAILHESGVEIKSIVVQDEFGEFMDMDINDFTKLKISGFNPHPNHDDDGGETMATSCWGGAGPDCISGQGEPGPARL